jgi:hypothetical protein
MAGKTLFREGLTCAFTLKRWVCDRKFSEIINPLWHENKLKIEKIIGTSNSEWNNIKRKRLTFSKQRNRICSTLDCMQA